MHGLQMYREGDLGKIHHKLGFKARRLHNQLKGCYFMLLKTIICLDLK